MKLDPPGPSAKGCYRDKLIVAKHNGPYVPRDGMKIGLPLRGTWFNNRRQEGWSGEKLNHDNDCMKEGVRTSKGMAPRGGNQDLEKGKRTMYGDCHVEHKGHSSAWRNVKIMSSPHEHEGQGFASRSRRHADFPLELK